MPSLFEQTVELEALGEGVYQRLIDDTWWGWNGQFGGYVMALALEACRLANGDPDQRERSLTMHFLRRHPAGTCRIHVVTERRGRTVTTFSLRITIDDVLCSVGLVMFGSDRRAEDYVTVSPPSDPAPTPAEPPGDAVSVGKALENVLTWPRHEGGYRRGGDHLTSGGWMALRDPGGADERFLLMAADGYLPVSYLRFTEPAEGGTLDFTAHFREVAPVAVVNGTEPVRVVLTSSRASEGYVDEDCSVWSADGRLLLQSRQVRYSQIVEEPGG